MWNPPAIPARQASLAAVPSSSPVTYVTVPRSSAGRLARQLARVRREAAGSAVAIAARLGSRAPTTPGTSTATRQSADVSLHPPPLPASLTCGTREYRFARRTRSSSAARRPSATPTSRSALARSASRTPRTRSAPGAFGTAQPARPLPRARSRRARSRYPRVPSRARRRSHSLATPLDFFRKFWRAFATGPPARSAVGPAPAGRTLGDLRRCRVRLSLATVINHQRRTRVIVRVRRLAGSCSVTRRRRGHGWW